MILETIVTLQAIVIAYGLYAGLDLRRWCRRTDEIQFMASQVAGMQQDAIRELQKHNVALERNIVTTQTALMFLAWRLHANGILSDEDSPADDTVAVH